MFFRDTVRFCTAAAFGVLLVACGDRAADPGTAPPNVQSANDSAAGSDREAGFNPPTPQLATPTQPAPSGRLGADPLGPTPAAWTIDSTSVARTTAEPVILVDAAASLNEGFDRVILEFEGDELPGYHIEYVDRPIIQCGSGDVIEIEGDGWLHVRLYPTHAHRETGQPSVIERRQKPGLSVVRELTLVCDFEAQVEWVLGVSAPNRYRVMELTDPARLVIDVRHEER